MTTLEKIAITKYYSKLKVNKSQEKQISNLLKDTNKKHHQFYIDFFLGYLKNKPKALKEDLQHAFDVASFYRDKPERFDFKNLKPVDLGDKKFVDISNAHKEYLKTKNKSKMQVAKRNGELVDGINIDVLYEDAEFKLYFIPRLKKNYSPEQLDQQHLKFCVVGKDTEWCTANPDGSYYEEYATDDIYTFHHNGKPYLQFNVKNNKISQMMNVQDDPMKIIDKKVLRISKEIFSQ
jgi:hypothetical protein